MTKNDIKITIFLILTAVFLAIFTSFFLESLNYEENYDFPAETLE